MAEQKGFTPDFDQRLNALIAASGGRISVTSGYRSKQRQAQLWNNALAKYGSVAAARKWVAPPGKSNHERGVAADLAGDLEWAHKNAARFGLRFPMAHERWHIEPIGLRSSKDAYTTPPDDGPRSDTTAGKRMQQQAHSADDGHDHGTEVSAPDPAEQLRHTPEYQLQSLAQILMGGDSGDEG